MTERDDTPEGWGVRQRVGYVAAIAVPTVLLAVVAGAGWAYATYLEPGTHAPVKTFPAPGIETYVHDGVNDPVRTRPAAKADPDIVAAERAVLANGDAGWPE